MYASTLPGSSVEVDVLASPVSATSYDHDADRRHPDGPPPPSRGCTWSYILDEVR